MNAIDTRQVLAAAILCASALTAWSAAAGVVTDDFNDNSRASFWKSFSPSTTNVKEKSSRLAFQSPTDAPGRREAGYASKGWTVRGDKSHTIEFDYCLEAADVEGNDAAAVGICTEIPGGSSTLDVFIIQTSEGYIVRGELFVNGQSSRRLEAAIDTSCGTVTYKYKKRTDTLKIMVNGKNELTFDTLNGNSGPFDLNVQLLAWSFGAVFGYNDVWADNFKVKGRIDD